MTAEITKIVKNAEVVKTAEVDEFAKIANIAEIANIAAAEKVFFSKRSNIGFFWTINDFFQKKTGIFFLNARGNKLVLERVLIEFGYQKILTLWLWGFRGKKLKSLNVGKSRRHDKKEKFLKNKFSFFEGLVYKNGNAQKLRVAAAVLFSYAIPTFYL